LAEASQQLSSDRRREEIEQEIRRREIERDNWREKIERKIKIRNLALANKGAWISASSDFFPRQ
jgi:hypothetical protein